jgi:hypothetical protein
VRVGLSRMGRATAIVPVRIFAWTRVSVEALTLVAGRARRQCLGRRQSSI